MTECVYFNIQLPKNRSKGPSQKKKQVAVFVCVFSERVPLHPLFVCVSVVYGFCVLGP